MFILRCINNRFQERVLSLNQLYFATEVYFDPFTKDDYFKVINCDYPGGYDIARFSSLKEIKDNKLFKLVIG